VYAIISDRVQKGTPVSYTIVLWGEGKLQKCYLLMSKSCCIVVYMDLLEVYMLSRLGLSKIEGLSVFF